MGALATLRPPDPEAIGERFRGGAHGGGFAGRAAQYARVGPMTERRCPADHNVEGGARKPHAQIGRALFGKQLAELGTQTEPGGSRAVAFLCASGKQAMNVAL